MTGSASPSQAGASSPSVLDSSAGMSPSQQTVPLGCPNSVLRIIIENMIYPITLDVLHQVCFCCILPVTEEIHCITFVQLLHDRGDGSVYSSLVQLFTID